MTQKYKKGSIVTVGKLNTHGFVLNEEIKILKFDRGAKVADIPLGTPIYYAQSKSTPKNKWWIAETEIAEPITTDSISKETNEGFTGGEWHVGSNLPGDEYALNILGGEHKAIIAKAEVSIYITDEQAEANARLIAEAPAMYKALKRIVEYMKDEVESQSPPFIEAKAIISRVQKQ